MQKVSQSQRLMLTLPGLLLLAAFLISSGAESLSGGIATAASADGYVAQNAAGCEHRKPSFGSAVAVGSGEVVCGNLTSFEGDIVINGEVDGDVTALGGNVVIDGKINGDVILYGGNLTSQSNAHINGDIHICGGRAIEDTNSQLHGSIFNCTQGVGLFLVSDVGTTFRFWFTLTWVVLGIFLTTLLPEHVMLVRTTVKIKMRRSLVLGLLSVLLAPAILAVLIALIIPIPLAIIVAIGLIAAWAFGTVAIGWYIGDYILHKLALQRNTRLMQVVVGLTVLALAESLPYVGWLISTGVGLLGLGAVFLSRFGTRLYSQPRRPLPL